MQVDTEAQSRSEVVSCRCSLLEVQLIRAMAVREEKTVSDYLRGAALADVEQLGRELVGVAKP